VIAFSKDWHLPPFCGMRTIPSTLSTQAVIEAGVDDVVAAAAAAPMASTATMTRAARSGRRRQRFACGVSVVGRWCEFNVRPLH
jgi:hypothetical protein